MANYSLVQQALATGADPAMLCAMCPWDRNCVAPPVMTSGDVMKAMEEAAAGADAGARALVMAMIVGGRDTAAEACPVLTLRLRSSGGRRIAEAVKGLMQGWEDS